MVFTKAAAMEKNTLDVQDDILLFMMNDDTQGCAENVVKRNRIIS
jgi:hypothetical protein